MIYLSKILVIGPLTTDMWHRGEVSSNPDGNYPCLRQNSLTVSQSGCAGSVAVNLGRLGNEVKLFATNPKKAAYATEADWFLDAPELYRFGVRSATPFVSVNNSSLKERFLDKDFTPLLRVDHSYFGSRCFDTTLDQLCAATQSDDYDAIYIADYETYTLEDGIASAKTLGDFCDWLTEEYKGITISDSRRVVYNTQFVKTNKTEWGQILDTKAWHLDQFFLVSKGPEGVEFWMSGEEECPDNPSRHFIQYKAYVGKPTISTCGAGDVLTSVFLHEVLLGYGFRQAMSSANYWASEATTRPYTCRVSLKAAL